jgi:hypothetical protein
VCVGFLLQIAEGLGFKGEFRQWEDLLRVGDFAGLAYSLGPDRGSAEAEAILLRRTRCTPGLP